MTKSEKLLERYEDAVNSFYLAEAYETADPNRESSSFASKKLSRIRNKVLKIMESKTTIKKRI